MQTGKVKFFNRRRGFGFVVSSEGDVLIHADVLSVLEGGAMRPYSLEEVREFPRGEVEVVYELIKHEGRLRASMWALVKRTKPIGKRDPSRVKRIPIQTVSA